MAAPFVAGHAALLRSLHPAMSAERVADRIGATAQPLQSRGVGAGRIDIAASLTAQGGDEDDDDGDDGDD